MSRGHNRAMSVAQPAARRAAGGLAIVLFAWWATADGGYAPGAWYPGALLVLAALAGCVRPGSYRQLSPPSRWALAAFAGFTVWSFCSIAWADARGEAWDGANRTLLYLTVFALFASVAWTAGEAAAGLAAFALATAAVGAWEIARALAGDAPAVFFDGRLAAPIGYENASAALFLAAFWAALLVAARRQTAGVARGVLLAAAGLLLQLTILAQSRGSLIAGAVTLAVAVALVRDRAPLLLALSGVALAAVASLPALLSVYDGGAPGGEPDLVPVVVAMGLSAAALFAWGLGPGGGSAVGGRTRACVAHARDGGGRRAGGRGGRRARARRRSGRGGARRRRLALRGRPRLGPLRLLAGGRDWSSRGTRSVAWAPTTSRTTTSGTGTAARSRSTPTASCCAPSPRPAPWALRCWRSSSARWRCRSGRPTTLRRPVAVAAFVTGAVWLIHGSIDWLWEIPAVAAPAMAALGLATGLARRDAAGPSPVAAGARIALAAVACAAALSYALPALSAREVDGAVREWSGDSAAALRRLERARTLNPLSDRPDLVAGLLARQAGDDAQARRALLNALDRDARSWNVHVELALLDLRDGRSHARRSGAWSAPAR